MTLNTVDLLAEALSVLERLGVRIRNEYLDGVQGGLCRLGKHYVLVLDVAQPATEQLPIVIQALKAFVPSEASLSPELSRILAQTAR